MDHYDHAEALLTSAEPRSHAPVEALTAALTHATLALVDRIDYLTYLMYGDE